jgi:hypothetical protein
MGYHRFIRSLLGGEPISVYGDGQQVRGNTYVEFETSVKAFGIRPGDLITVTYLKEGLNRQAFRVLKIAPGANHRISSITAQIHDDSWYADSNGQVTSASGGRRLGSAGVGVPRPLMGSVLDDHGDVQFDVQESATTVGDGTVQTNVAVGFVAPSVAAAGGPGIPMISLAATVGSAGTLAGGQTLYYAISAVDASGAESSISFVVRAITVSGGSSVTLTGLSFSPATSCKSNPADCELRRRWNSCRSLFTDDSLARSGRISRRASRKSGRRSGPFPHRNRRR